MLGVSTYCLHGETLDVALEQISGITSVVEVMDEGYHYLENTSVLENYSLHYTIHAPYHGINIASIFETIRRASIEVTLDCFSVAAEIGAILLFTPVILPGSRNIVLHGDNLINLFRNSPVPRMTFHWHFI